MRDRGLIIGRQRSSKDEPSRVIFILVMHGAAAMLPAIE